MRIVVSAGPTREMIDDVRYLSNLSSGKTGYAIACAARDRGHEVVLVSGPVALAPPDGVRLVPVISAREMHAAVLLEARSARVVIMSAAVADYRPRERIAGKLKKADADLRLDLVRNPDILRELGDRKDGRVLIGFALEVQDAEAHARSKLERKNADLIVLNGPGNLGSATSTFRLVTRTGVSEAMALDKRALGELLVQRAEQLADERQRDGDRT